MGKKKKKRNQYFKGKGNTQDTVCGSSKTMVLPKQQQLIYGDEIFNQGTMREGMGLSTAEKQPNA